MWVYSSFCSQEVLPSGFFYLFESLHRNNEETRLQALKVQFLIILCRSGDESVRRGLASGRLPRHEGPGAGEHRA